MRFAFRTKNAFTLVELLVVIGIIAVLISLLLPVLGRAREQSRAVACASNMHQVALAVNLFLNANRGEFPRAPLLNDPRENDAVMWQSDRLDTIGEYGLGKYLKMTRDRKDMLTCPTDTEAAGRETTKSYPFTYSFNENMNGTGPAAVKKATQVSQPALKIYVIEENGPTLKDGSATLWARTGGWANVGMLGLRHDRINRTKYPDASTATTGIVNRNGKANVLCVDGHVEYLSRGDAHTKRRTLPDATLFPNDADGGPGA